jgi:hypothetical protein
MARIVSDEVPQVRVPQVGDIVFYSYRRPGYEQWNWAAIITQVLKPGQPASDVSLTVFWLLTDNIDSDTIGIPYSADGRNRTWNWRD